MSKAILAAALIVAATVTFGYLGAALLEDETGRKILGAIAAGIALVMAAEVVHIVVDRLRGRTA
jgi:hypothetical protein